MTLPHVEAPSIETFMPIVGHTAAGTGLLAIILGWLPPIIGLLGGLAATTYYVICVWESRTVQHYVGNWRMKRKAKRIARLKAREKILTAELEALEVVREAKTVAAEKVAFAAHEATKQLIHEATEAEAHPRPVRKG